MQYRPERISVTAGSVDDEHSEALKELLERGNGSSGSKKADGNEFTEHEMPQHIFMDEKVEWADLETLASKVPRNAQFQPGRSYSPE